MVRLHLKIGAMRNTHRYPSAIAFVFAFAFFSLQAVALAHEVEHDVGQHNQASCGLHLYIEHFATTTTAGVTLALTPAPTIHLPAPTTSIGHTVPTLGYYGRAPPLSLSSTHPISG